MKTLKKLSLLLFLSTFAFYSCEKDDDVSKEKISFGTTKVSVNKKDTTIEVEIKLSKVQLVDVVIPFTILADSSTAIAGQDYVAPSETTVTIKASATSGYLKLVLKSNQYYNAAGKKLVLQLGTVPADVASLLELGDSKMTIKIAETNAPEYTGTGNYVELINTTTTVTEKGSPVTMKLVLGKVATKATKIKLYAPDSNKASAYASLYSGITKDSITVNFAVGERTKEFTITPIDNKQPNPNAKLKIALAYSSDSDIKLGKEGTSTNKTTVLNITDDEVAPCPTYIWVGNLESCIVSVDANDNGKFDSGESVGTTKPSIVYDSTNTTITNFTQLSAIGGSPLGMNEIYTNIGHQGISSAAQKVNIVFAATNSTTGTVKIASQSITYLKTGGNPAVGTIQTASNFASTYDVATKTIHLVITALDADGQGGNYILDIVGK